MYSDILIKRLQKELRDLEKEPPPGITCYPKEDNITELEAYVKGPPDSPYEKGLFKLDIEIPHKYPFEPPQIRFKTPIYHPNIDDGGRICADILKTGGWKPALNLSTTLISLAQLMAHPNPDDPLDAEIAREYQIDYPQFRQKAVQYTDLHASGKPENETGKVDRLERTKPEKEEEREPQVDRTQSRFSLLLSKKRGRGQGDSSTRASGSCSRETAHGEEKGPETETETEQRTESAASAHTTEKNICLSRAQSKQRSSQGGEVSDEPAFGTLEHQEQGPDQDAENETVPLGSDKSILEQCELIKDESTHLKPTEKHDRPTYSHASKNDSTENQGYETLETEKNRELKSKPVKEKETDRLQERKTKARERQVTVIVEETGKGVYSEFSGDTQPTGVKRGYNALDLVQVIEISDDEDSNETKGVFSEPMLHSLRLSKKLKRNPLNLSKKKTK